MLHNAIDLGPVVFRFEEYVFSIICIMLFSWILILHEPV